MRAIACIVVLHFALSGLFAQIKNHSAYSESEMVLKTPTGDLYGTVTIPDHSKPTPILLIIAGSGPRFTLLISPKRSTLHDFMDKI